MKELDIEAKLFILLLHLKEEKMKIYSCVESKTNVVYVFDNYCDFKLYFLQNGFTNVSDDLLEICKMKVTKKGTVIALKELCDYTIRRYKEKEALTNSETNKIYVKKEHI